MAILDGVRIIEFEGLGPAPFCGMLLADHGADVILVERQQPMGSGPAAIFKRGKRSLALDLKNETHRDAAARLVATADALIEGFRPGVMERLGLGPERLCRDNPRLVYGRITGWGQTGPLSQAAGHDANYIGLSGAAWYAGAAGERPVAPPTLVGDVGGGALYLAFGVLAGILKARETGKGTVVDAAIVDGAAHMTNLLLSLRAAGGLPETRGQSMLDGAPFYETYETSDGEWVTLGPLEPKFYALLLEKLGLTDDPDFTSQFNASRWPVAREKLRRLFASEPRQHWRTLLEGSDVCFAPVLRPGEAAAHPHMAARGAYREIDGVLHALAAPRFDGAPPGEPGPTPAAGAHTDEILAELGIDAGVLG